MGFGEPLRFGVMLLSGGPFSAFRDDPGFGGLQSAGAPAPWFWGVLCFGAYLILGCPYSQWSQFWGVPALGCPPFYSTLIFRGVSVGCSFFRVPLILG